MSYNRIIKALSALAMLAAVSACHIYTDELATMQDDMEEIRAGSLATIEGQVEALNNTVDAIEQVRPQLLASVENYTTATNDLDGRTSEARQALSDMADSLRASFDASKADLADSLDLYVNYVDKSLESLNILRKAIYSGYETLGLKADTLNVYVKDLSESKRDTATSTYMTLEQYKGVCEEIAGLSAKADVCDSTLNAIDAKVQDFLENGLGKALEAVDDSTKAHCSDVLSDISGQLDQAVKTITDNYSAELKEAIDAVETDIKDSVAEDLYAYWTIAETEAQLTSFEDEIARKMSQMKINGDAILKLQDDLNVSALTKEQKDSLMAKADSLEDAMHMTESQAAANSAKVQSLKAQMDTLSEEITAQYTAAINEAVASYGATAHSVIDARIAAANEYADSKLAELTTELADMEVRMTSLESRMAAVESQVTKMTSNAYDIMSFLISALDRVQSVIVVPDNWSDASVSVVQGESDIRFEAHPADAASQIVSYWSYRPDAVTMQLRCHETGETAELTITQVTFDAPYLTVTVNFEDLADDFWQGSVSYAARLLINVGGTYKATDYFNIKG